jgi:hypothetical protein
MTTEKWKEKEEEGMGPSKPFKSTPPKIKLPSTTVYHHLPISEEPMWDIQDPNYSMC